MAYVEIERLLEKVGSLYKLVTLASRRVLELSEGAQPLVETDEKDPSAIALKEIAEGKIFLDQDNKEKKKKKKKKKGK